MNVNVEESCGNEAEGDNLVEESLGLAIAIALSVVKCVSNNIPFLKQL